MIRHNKYAIRFPQTCQISRHRLNYFFINKLQRLNLTLQIPIMRTLVRRLYVYVNKLPTLPEFIYGSQRLALIIRLQRPIRTRNIHRRKPRANPNTLNQVDTRDNRPRQAILISK